MLWFSIPAVIFLASIPVLIIASQTTEFKMRRISFQTKMGCFLFLVAAFSAYCGFVVSTPLATIAMIMWLSDDKKVTK